ADFAQELQQQYPNQPKALLIPSIKNYLRPLATQLEQRAVPFELDVKTPFGATGFGAALLALLRVCIGDDQQANGLAFALSAYSGLSPDQVLELDTRWRRYRVSPASMLTQLSQHPSGACDSLRLIRSSSMSARIGDWSSLVTQLYARGAQAHRSSNFDLLQDAAAQKSATTALQELYEQKFAQHTKKLQLADGVDDSDDQQPGSRILSYDPRITAAELYASLRETLIAQTPKAASPAILIAQPARVYGRQFHSVIVGGLAAESETEKADNSLDVRLAATLSGTPTPDLAQQQQFNYYAIRSLAQHNLYLVAQHETLGGETLKPGGLLRMVQQDQNSKAQHSDQQIACRYKSNDEVIASQSYATAEKQAEIEGILAQTQPPLHLRQPPRGEAAYFDLGYGDKSPVAATTLQDFENCPYYWLLHRFAAGKEVDRGFDRREQGTFAHQVLKLFYEELPISGIGERITGANLDEALDLYQQIFDKEAAKLQEKLPFTLAEQAELVMLGSMLADFLQSEVDYAPEFVPRYLEYRFGYDATGSDGPDSATTEPVDLGLGLPLRGSIDRIDVRADDDAALIIDYKRTSDVGGLVAQANNNLFQGVLYRLVAEKVLPIRPVSHSYRAYGDINAKPSEAYAREDNPPERPLGLPKIGRAKIGGLSEKEMHEGFEKILESAGRAAHDLHIGRVEKRANRSLCQYCLYDGCEHKPRQGGRR
ncbi:MAG: PD-(D/E)XK nuclease family protein, partial [Coriobacteriia bacterium]|nr:PD-(D/E)XK nuclease family protein [Coriobacteriia bacterium]